MKNSILTLLICASLLSCNWLKKEEEKPAIEDVSKEVVIGGDKDANGCLASAGYTWSKLNKECVRIFTGIQLLPTDKSENEEDAVFAAYILFDEDKKKAEIFLPNQDDSIILKQVSKGKSWSNDEWELLASDGFILKKTGQILYKGDGQIGATVSGSDDSEEIPETK